jgi:uncharacterized protein
MKINIDQIPESGLELKESLIPGDLDLSRSDVKFTEPIDISCQANKGIGIVSLNLRFCATMHLTCGRCLQEFNDTLSRQLKLDLPLEGAKELDITDNLREEIILSFPLKPLCRADCRGLCPQCGQNLNKGRCNHGSTEKKTFKDKT